MEHSTPQIYTEFLPISRADMEARGWEQLDFVVVGGDAYVDHPSFGTAIISRLLEAEGYKVGVLAQPRYTDCDKKKNEIGGVDYMYPEMVENFSQYAQTSFYSYKNQYPELEVLKYNIISYSPSKVTIAGLEDNDYYNILISLTFNEEIEGLNSTVNVTVVRVEDRYYVCGLDNA